MGVVRQRSGDRRLGSATTVKAWLVFFVQRAPAVPQRSTCQPVISDGSPRGGPDWDGESGTEPETKPGSTRTWFAPTLHLQAADKTWNAASSLAPRSCGWRGDEVGNERERKIKREQKVRSEGCAGRAPKTFRGTQPIRAQRLRGGGRQGSRQPGALSRNSPIPQRQRQLVNNHQQLGKRGSTIDFSKQWNMPILESLRFDPTR